MKSTGKVPTIKQCEGEIGPAREWKGRCHEVALKLHQSGLIRGRVAYGHWLGPIKRKSFFNERRGMPFVQHGWILQNTVIIDPTRWVFEAATPYVFSGKDEAGFYDEGGNLWRENSIGSAPAFNEDESSHEVILTDDVHQFIADLLCDGPRDQLSMGQMFYIANRSPKTLGTFTQAIYEWLERIGCKAFVPLDNWIMIMD